MSSYCDKCKRIVSKHESNNNQCKCGSSLKYIGSCGQCLEFLEYYGGIGTCDYKDKVKATNNGCEHFK
ncbi:MAG: hypothetical protein ACRCX8_20795 [Sarcina sp.]